jgi:hypothetical protein
MPATVPAFDLYAELGLDRSASPEAVEAAYRRLIKQHHPDRAGDAGVERSKRLNVAHAWLRDPVRREAYDNARATPIVGVPAWPPSPYAGWTAQGASRRADGAERGERSHEAGFNPNPDQQYAARPQRPAAPAAGQASASGHRYARADLRRPSNDADFARQERVLARRLLGLLAVAVAISIAIGALQNGGSILGRRQPALPPPVLGTSEPTVRIGTVAQPGSPAATSTVAATLKPNAILEGNHPYWTGTGIEVTAGERLRISASGQILWDPTVREPTVGPEGASWTPDNVASPDEFLFQQSPIASLIGEVNGKMFWIGASQDITAPASGELKLAMNERWVAGSWDDNQGSWSIVVERE